MSCIADGGLEEDGLEEARVPVAASDEFAVSEDESDDFIDDDDGEGPSRRKGRVKARKTPQGVSSHGIQV